MLTLIAESKTMTECADAVDTALLAAHRPVLEPMAAEIMTRLASISPATLARLSKLSPAMTARLRLMIGCFPDKSRGSEAIDAYTGVVFKAFDSATLSDAERRRAASSVRIISSLYGWLKPDDIIKPYRLDFTMPLAPGDTPLASWLKTAVTDRLLADIAATGSADIINLLPGDAARCVDWPGVEAVAKVWKVEFLQVMPGGSTRTPNSNLLKKLRGRLLRRLVADDITTPAALASLVDPSFMPAEASAPSTISFMTT